MKTEEKEDKRIYILSKEKLVKAVIKLGVPLIKEILLFIRPKTVIQRLTFALKMRPCGSHWINYHHSFKEINQPYQDI